MDRPRNLVQCSNRNSRADSESPSQDLLVPQKSNNRRKRGVQADLDPSVWNRHDDCHRLDNLQLHIKCRSKLCHASRNAELVLNERCDHTLQPWSGWNHRLSRKQCRYASMGRLPGCEHELRRNEANQRAKEPDGLLWEENNNQGSFFSSCRS